ncbi:cytochrome o ubiquinol oxidase subunit IV [Shigella flexneri]|nr:cytochrome o ubiquinol oxidase subunit IV [Shigella flexneri]
MSHSTDHSGASHGSVKTYMTEVVNKNWPPS